MTRPARAARAATATTCVALVLAGCSFGGGGDGDLATTPLDVERASAAWSDPWAAPDAPTLPGADVLGSNPVRGAGTRTTQHPAGQDATAAALTEVRSAEAAGWSLLGAVCGVDGVEAALGRGTTVDDGMRASLVTEPTAGSEGTVTVQVDVEVAHHGDGAWPAAEPVDVPETCLDGGDPGSDTLPADPPPDAYDPGGGEAGPEGPVEWERSEPTSAEAALREALVDDPWVRGLGVEPQDEPRVEPGADERGGEVFVAAVPTDAADPAGAIVEALTGATAWDVTWVSCGAGSPGAVSARFTTPDGAATARLEAADGRTVDVEVRLPVPEAPPFAAVTDPPALDVGAPCLDGPEPASPTAEGTPVANPGPLRPYLG